MNLVHCPTPWRSDGYIVSSTLRMVQLTVRAGEWPPRASFQSKSSRKLIRQLCDPMDGSPPTYNCWAVGYSGPQTSAFALLTPDEPNGMPSTGMAASALPLPKKWTSNEIAVRFGRTSSPAAIPNFKKPFQRVVKGKPCDSRILGTPHSSGILVALADGSVRSAAPNISAYTFWAACTPDGNETLYTDW